MAKSLALAKHMLLRLLWDVRSLSIPLAQQLGAQIDGGVKLGQLRLVSGRRAPVRRDPSIGLLGAYGSYVHWHGNDVANIGRIGADIGLFATEGEYDWSRLTFHGLAGYETVHLNGTNVADPPGLLSIPNRFFDLESAL